MDKLKNKKNLIFLGIIIILILIILYWYKKSEYMVPFFLDQMTMAYSDPLKFNYTGREKDVAGMSERDYYLENQMNSETGVGPQYLEGDLQFVDHTGYMDMPIQSRPLLHPTPLAMRKLAEINSNNFEEWAYQDLNRTGDFPDLSKMGD